MLSLSLSHVYAREMTYDTNLLINGECESMAGWTDPNGKLWSSTNEIEPHEGKGFLWPASGATGDESIDAESFIYQDVDLTHFKPSEYAVLTGWLANWNQSPNDRSTLQLELLDKNGNIVVADARMQRDPEWHQHMIVLAIPAGVTKARIKLIATRFVGSDNDGYFDDISFIVSQKQYQLVTVTGDKEKAIAGEFIQCTANNGQSTNPASYEWSSSYQSVATVDTNGRVTMLDNSEVAIYAKDKSTGVVGVYWINSKRKNKVVESKITVTFDAMGGTPTPNAQHIASGEVAIKPTEVIRNDGMIVYGWSLDPTTIISDDMLFDFSTPLSSDTTLYAQYTSDYYVCSFDTAGGVPANIPTQLVLKNQKIQVPQSVNGRPGESFAYWGIITDSGKYQPYDFNTPVVKDTELVAFYKSIGAPIVVTFDTVGGTPTPPFQTVQHGEKVVKPNVNPTKDGYTFTAWVTAAGVYDFSKPVERDFIIYAKYKKAGSSNDKSRRSDIIIDDKDYDKAIINYQKALFKGYPDSTFRPEKTITRAEMATIFVRMIGLEDTPFVAQSSFNDIDGHWAKSSIQKAVDYGVLKGYPDGSYKPDKPMKRAEIAAVINNYWHIKGFIPDTSAAPISDIKGHWAKQLILALYNHRFTDLYLDQSFKPDNPLLRSEVAQIVNRITDRPIISTSTQRFSDVYRDHWAFLEIATAASKIAAQR